MCDQKVESCDCVDEETECSNARVQEGGADIVMLRFPNFDFRSISIRFLAQNDDFDSIQF